MKIILLLLLLSALLFSYNQSEVSVINSKWKCEDSDNKQTCNIVFYAVNKGNESVNASIYIRAHYLGGKGGVGQSNAIRGEKTIKTFLFPNEKKHFNETLIANGRVSFIVTTIVNNGCSSFHTTKNRVVSFIGCAISPGT